METKEQLSMELDTTSNSEYDFHSFVESLVAMAHKDIYAWKKNNTIPPHKLLGDSNAGSIRTGIVILCEIIIAYSKDLDKELKESLARLMILTYVKYADTHGNISHLTKPVKNTFRIWKKPSAWILPYKVSRYLTLMENHGYYEACNLVTSLIVLLGYEWFDIWKLAFDYLNNDYKNAGGE